MVPHKLESKNHFVIALREAFEHTLKEVRAAFSLPSLRGTKPGAARK